MITLCMYKVIPEGRSNICKIQSKQLLGLHSIAIAEINRMEKPITYALELLKNIIRLLKRSKTKENK